MSTGEDRLNYSVGISEDLKVKIPEGGFPDEEYMTLDEAAKEWEVTRANIKYFIIVKGVPTKKKIIPIPVRKDIIHVHMPSLKAAKDRRIHTGAKDRKKKGRVSTNI